MQCSGLVSSSKWSMIVDEDETSFSRLISEIMQMSEY